MIQANGMKPTTNELLDQKPPASIEAEMAVLGGVLNDPSRIEEISHLGAGEFHDDRCQRVFRAAHVIHGRGQRIDLTLLRAQLDVQGDGEITAAFLAELIRMPGLAVNVPHYASILTELSKRRKIILTATELLRDAYNGVESATLLEQAFGNFDAIGSGLADGISPVDVAALHDAHPRLAEYLIDGLLRRGETMNIIAAPKVGKSWLTYSLALAIVTGELWLGQFQCRAGRVLTIDNELHPATLAHRVRVAADGAAVREDEYRGRWDVLSLRGRLMDLPAIASTLEKIKPGTYDAIILDAFYRALPDGVNENDNASMAGLYNLIDRSAGRLNVSWINVHHSSKGSQATKEVTDIGAGAGAQSRAADTHLVLRPHEEQSCFVLDAVVRSFAPVDPLPLRWAFPCWRPATELDPALVKGRGTRAEEKQNENDKKGVEQILNKLRSGPATVRALRAGKMGLDRCKRLLDRLEEEGRIKWEEAVVSRNRCRLYSMKQGVNDEYARREAG